MNSWRLRRLERRGGGAAKRGGGMLNAVEGAQWRERRDRNKKERLITDFTLGGIPLCMTIPTLCRLSLLNGGKDHNWLAEAIYDI